MKTKIMLLVCVVLLVVSCRERTNIFDIENENFVTPPCSDAAAVAGYYDPNGYLVGVGIAIDFTDPFERSLPVLFQFYQDISLRLEYEEVFAASTEAHYVVIYGPYDIGLYSLQYSFGGIPLGAAIFQVTENDGLLVVQGTTLCNVQSQKSSSWYYSSH